MKIIEYIILLNFFFHSRFSIEMSNKKLKRCLPMEYRTQFILDKELNMDLKYTSFIFWKRMDIMMVKLSQINNEYQCMLLY